MNVLSSKKRTSIERWRLSRRTGGKILLTPSRVRIGRESLQQTTKVCSSAHPISFCRQVLISASTDPKDIQKLVKMIILKNYHPVIVFSFSRRECEALAMQMIRIEFNNSEEQEMVNKVFTSAISALSEQEQKLPQIEHSLPLLKRGIGVHHGGLLPILKEVIEILFQEGLIKVLFATETFSMGLNMPAKTVVFATVRKFDGKAFRTVSGGEYIQMSGRAGRRGLDDRGTVILICDEKLQSETAMQIVKGQADRL